MGRAFARLLTGPYGHVLRRYGVRARVTGIATARHGCVIDPRGLPLARCLGLVGAGRPLLELHEAAPIASTGAFLRRVPADVLVEVTPLDLRCGQPAVAHVRAALRRGLHVVTANKGPVAFAAAGLRALARRRRRLFLHESAVMDGTPVFNLWERCLPGLRLLGFRGTLNSTTNYILTRMEEGARAAAALREAQALGIAEADPRHDLDGWDAAVKGCALANALMGASLRPAGVARRGIAGLTGPALRRALHGRTRMRLVVRAAREGRRVRLTVGPERLPLGDPLSAPGPDAALVLSTDLAGEIGIVERGGTVAQTAYGVLADLLEVAQAERMPRWAQGR